MPFAPKLSARLQQTCPLLLAAAVLLPASGCSKLGGGSNTENSPVGPSSNFNVTGTWTGTLSRPDGSTVAVRWQAATGSGDGALTGPVTLTYNGASVTVPGLASVAGNDRSGYTFLLGMMGKPGDTPALPNCYVIGTAPAEPFRAPYNSISTSPFEITYNNCSGFIAPAPQRLQVTESTRLTLNK